MAGPIYKLWMFRPREVWYQLSKEERDSFTNKVREDIEKSGGKERAYMHPNLILGTMDGFWHRGVP